MNDALDTSSPAQEAAAAQAEPRFKWIGWSSLFFAVVQSVCTIFAALSGMRLLIGAAAFSAAVGLMKIADNKIHIDPIRIPMVVLAVAGAVFNLAALWQVRRLRGRAASAWRQKAVSRSKFASEGVQLTLSLLTLLLLGLESFYHFRHAHHL